MENSMFFIWTIGCQMNVAESNKIRSILISHGAVPSKTVRDANLIILNTCVVRQSAENKVIGMLNMLKGIKGVNKTKKIIVTGCFVEPDLNAMYSKYPYVDLFFKPGSYYELVKFISTILESESFIADYDADNRKVTYLLPIMQGCNNYCSYCIVPYRRGRETSKKPSEIISELNKSVSIGIKEVTLLGQNVNSYGHDLNPPYSLTRLLNDVIEIDQIRRIRFLTNHPKDMSDELIQTVAKNEKICKHLNIPLQSGSDKILQKMHRDYKVVNYFDLINKIKQLIPGVAISTDIIVGFPGETDRDFEDTVGVIENIQFDTVHVAMYSPRPGTFAATNYVDDISKETKLKRLRKIEDTQKKIATQINNGYLGKLVEILIEGRKNDKWYGRTDTNKMVFVNSDKNIFGEFVEVKITKSSPWSLQGEII